MAITYLQNRNASVRRRRREVCGQEWGYAGGAAAVRRGDSYNGTIIV